MNPEAQFVIGGLLSAAGILTALGFGLWLTKKGW